MTDQTPRTEAGRHFVYHWRIFMGDDATAEVLAIEAEAAAQARTEALERVRALMPHEYTVGAHVSPLMYLQSEVLAILAGETE